MTTMRRRMGVIVLALALAACGTDDGVDGESTLPADAVADTVDTLSDTLRIFAEMMAGLTVKADAMERAALKGYATATDLADYLVKQGLAFRDAHEIVAHAVKTAQAQGIDLSALPLEALRQFDARIGEDVYEVLSLAGSLNARNILGGTAPAQVRAQVARHRARLAAVAADLAKQA